MDRSHVVRPMFVASVAGVAAVIIVGVTSHACGVVIAIQHEELVMVERSGLPAFRAVALFATHAEIAMNVVLWSGVASLAAIPCSCTQQRMRERVLAAQSELPSLVIAVAGQAILLD